LKMALDLWCRKSLSHGRVEDISMR
jgi:hypothetical protein